MALAATALAGCGGSDSASRSAVAITVPPPKTPTAASCGLNDKGGGKSDLKPPEPGAYDYSLTGTRALIGDSKQVKKLPSSMQLVVTPNVSSGRQTCFALQRKYEKDLGDTGTLVIDGEDMYLRSGRFQAGGDITDILPDPPILVLSGSQLDWSGTFRGATSGRFSASVAGRKTIRVGGEPVKVVGVQMRVAYAGELEGFERSTRWFSLDKGVVVAETVRQRRKYGLDEMRLNYSSRLKSLRPS